MATGKAILGALRQELNLSDYRKKHWEGGFEEYLDIVRAKEPAIDPATKLRPVMRVAEAAS